MNAGLLPGLAVSAWARTALGYGATTLAIFLFLLAFRRSGERVQRLAERLKNKEQTNEIQSRNMVAAARSNTPTYIGSFTAFLRWSGRSNQFV